VGSPLDALAADDDLTVRGEIGTSSVPDLLRSLLRSGETGLLSFRRGELTKTLSMRGGQIVYAASNNVDERLGESLLVRGQITARQYFEASRLIRPNRRLGAVLVELGAIQAEELVPAVEAQVKEIVLELFGWPDGQYEFAIKEPPDTLVSLSISTENLILEGMRRSSWSQVIRGLGDVDTVLAPTGNTDVLYKLDLSDEEQEVLSHVNGHSSVEQICEVSYLSHFETCRILWALQVLGVVRRAGAGDEPAVEGRQALERELDLEDIVEKFNQMFGRIFTFLKGRLGEDVYAFMDAALEEVSRQYGVLFDGVDLKPYGRADFEQMLANVADLPPEQRRSLIVSGLNELVFVLQLAVRMRRRRDEEAVISGIIKDGFRRLGGP
jgi:hypothetical protein